MNTPRLKELHKELEEHIKRTAELQKKFEEASKAEEGFKFPECGYYLSQTGKQVEGYISSRYQDPEDPELYATASLAEYYGKIIRKNMIIAQYVAQEAPDYRLEDLGEFEGIFFVSTGIKGDWVVHSYSRVSYTIPFVIYMPESVAVQLVEDLNSGKINLEEL